MYSPYVPVVIIPLSPTNKLPLLPIEISRPTWLSSFALASIGLGRSGASCDAGRSGAGSKNASVNTAP